MHFLYSGKCRASGRRGEEASLSEIFVYQTATGEADAAAAEALRRSLSADERARAARLHQFEAARDFMAAHALTRHALRERYGITAPAYEIGAFGKPRLDGRGPRFSLTHARGLVACAFSSELEIGVDAEANTPPADRDLIARDICAPEEAAAFEAADPQRRDEHFLRLWTLKEAVTKATGLGAQLEPRDFAVDLAVDSAVDLASPALARACPELQPGRQWRLWQWRRDPSHIVALAARGEAVAMAEVRRVDISIETLTRG